MRKTRSIFMRITFFSILFSFLVVGNSFAQGSLKKDKSITYEEVYDLPYEINPLYIHLQPMYADVYQTNVNFGFGLEAQYYLEDKFDFRIHGRKAYSRRFDIARDDAEKKFDDGTGNVSFEVYNFFEIGATYHINEREEESSSKIILYSKRYKPNKWAATIPKHIAVPSKVRKYYGVRLGGMFYNTTTDIARAAEKQGVGLTDQLGAPVTDQFVFANLGASAVYVGGSMTWIKNFAVKPDRDFGVLISDLNLNTFLDLIIAPSVSIEDIMLNGNTISSDPIEVSSVGFRAGLEGKFNRKLAWGYGAEIGVRPGVAQRSFYTMFKVSFPVFSAALKHEQEAFVK